MHWQDKAFLIGECACSLGIDKETPEDSGLDLKERDQH